MAKTWFKNIAEYGEQDFTTYAASHTYFVRAETDRAKALVAEFGVKHFILIDNKADDSIPEIFDAVNAANERGLTVAASRDYR